MIVHWRKGMLTINEFYNDTLIGLPSRRADLDIHYQLGGEIETKNPHTIHREELHLCIDLTKTTDTLLKEMKRTTRRDIKKAKDYHFTIEYMQNPGPTDINEFVEFYNGFAVAKNIPVCNHRRLIALAKSRRLTISTIHHQKRKLVSHAIIINKPVAIGLYSGSCRFNLDGIPKGMIAQANRFLHWKDLLFFKEKEFQTFNQMGLSIDPSDQSFQQINKFKRGFGGYEAIATESYLPQTFKGFIVVYILKFLWRNKPNLITQNYRPVSRYLEEKHQ